MGLSHTQGRQAEQQAAEFLEAKGLTIIARNVRKKMGELDIICRDKAYWVCVEVKYRDNHAHGHPLEAVTATKLRRMTAAFNLYLLDNGLNPAHIDMRFDVIAIDENELTWLTNVTV